MGRQRIFVGARHLAPLRRRPACTLMYGETKNLRRGASSRAPTKKAGLYLMYGETENLRRGVLMRRPLNNRPQGAPSKIKFVRCLTIIIALWHSKLIGNHLMGGLPCKLSCFTIHSCSSGALSASRSDFLFLILPDAKF